MPYVKLKVGAYLLDTLFVVGPHSLSAMGEPILLSWSDLVAYAQATGAVGEPWEFETLHEMSRAYLEGRKHGESHFAIAPLELAGNDRDR